MLSPGLIVGKTVTAQKILHRRTGHGEWTDSITERKKVSTTGFLTKARRCVVVVAIDTVMPFIGRLTNDENHIKGVALVNGRDRFQTPSSIDGHVHLMANEMEGIETQHGCANWILRTDILYLLLMKEMLRRVMAANPDNSPKRNEAPHKQQYNG